MKTNQPLAMNGVASLLRGTPRVPRLQAMLTAIVGLMAVSGGLSLLLTPDGSAIGLPLSMLAGTGFQSYLVPGFLLAVVVGGLNLYAAVLSGLKSEHASVVSFAAGASLLVFIVAELFLIPHHHPLQVVMLALGTAITVLAVPRSER